MMLDEKEFELFCAEITKVAAEEGISFSTITTILAKAIKNREEEIAKKKSTKVMETPQMVYGPPQRMETIEVMEELQLVYGPPQRREFVEVIQNTRPRKK